MATDPKKVIRDLKKEIGHDFSSTTRELHNNLVNTTPAQSGNARSGWRNTYQNQLFKQKDFEVERNNVDYIGILDTGTSRQAPRGIVMPAAKKTRNLR